MAIGDLAQIDLEAARAAAKRFFAEATWPTRSKHAPKHAPGRL
jgi:hypothetical protein